MFTVRQRTPTELELKTRLNPRAERRVNYGCALLVMGVVPAFLGWKIIGWLMRKNGVSNPVAALLGGLAVGVAGCTPALIGLRKMFRERANRRPHKQEEQVEEFEIETRKVSQLVASGEDEPVLAFELDDQTILLLKGQWLREPETYGYREKLEEPFEDFLNELPSPYSFPTLRFKLVRWAASGHVISIVPSGDYVSPENSKVEIKDSYPFEESEIIKGSFSDLQAVLDRAV